MTSSTVNGGPAQKETTGSELVRGRLLLGALDSSRNPVAILNTERAVVSCNFAFAALQGLIPGQLRGRDLAEVTPDPAAVETWWESFIAGLTMSGFLPVSAAPDGRESLPFNASPNIISGSHLITGFYPEEVVGKSVERSGDDDDVKSKSLTPRERHVLQLIALGRRGEEIAFELGISGETVKTYSDGMRRKLGARTRAEAVALGLLRGEIKLR